jgi:hypothetical protein
VHLVDYLDGTQGAASFLKQVEAFCRTPQEKKKRGEHELTGHLIEHICKKE